MFRLSHRLLQGCAALLALALSALGGARLGVERALAATDPSDERPAIERCAAVVQACAAVVAVAAPLPRAAAPAPAAPRTPAPATPRLGTVPCALLLGCALGPRAP